MSRFQLVPIRRLVSFVGLLLPAAAFAADVPTQLAADGKTSFVIVTATEPSLEEKTAAQWLSETLEQVTGAKFPIRAASKDDAHKTDQLVTAEFRIPWTDLPTDAKPNDQLLLNIATFPKLDSRVPSHVSSPWLIGNSPTYNPAYYGSIRLGEKD